MQNIINKMLVFFQTCVHFSSLIYFIRAWVSHADKKIFFLSFLLFYFHVLCTKWPFKIVLLAVEDKKKMKTITGIFHFFILHFETDNM